jgi:hypothetical protein
MNEFRRKNPTGLNTIKLIIIRLPRHALKANKFFFSNDLVETECGKNNNSNTQMRNHTLIK